MMGMILMQLSMMLINMGLQVTFYTAAAYCVTKAIKAAWKGK